MMRIAVSCEGQTEEEFVNRVLQDHFLAKEKHLQPILVRTKRVVGGGDFKGGDVSIGRARYEVSRLLGNFDHVTTLYDFYGFRGREPNESGEELTGRLANAVGTARNFTPYIQMHEFEALIYSDPRVIARYLGGPEAARDAEHILRQYGDDPERIDDGPETAPSKRLMEISAQHLKRPYRKVRDGVRLARDISLPQLREACRRFDGWLKILEAL